MTQGQSQGRLLTIQKFADVCRTSLKTLRIYERKGLLKPFKADNWNNYRYYLPEQSEDFMRIKLLQSFNLSLEQIKPLLKKKPVNIPINDELEKLSQEIKDKKKKYNFLKNICEFLFKEIELSRDLTEENIGPLRLLCLKVDKGEYSKVSSYSQEIWQLANKLEIKAKQEVLFYLDPEYKPKDAKLEICLTYSGEIKDTQLADGCYFRTMPKIKALSFKYIGPYPYLRLVYQKLFSYFYDQKIKIKEPIFEIYERGPIEIISEFGYTTKLVFPIN